MLIIIFLDMTDIKWHRLFDPSIAYIPLYVMIYMMYTINQYRREE